MLRPIDILSWCLLGAVAWHVDLTPLVSWDGSRRSVATNVWRHVPKRVSNGCVDCGDYWYNLLLATVLAYTNYGTFCVMDGEQNGAPKSAIPCHLEIIVTLADNRELCRYLALLNKFDW
jgi:hypothetical protein